ncbi:MAG: gliding motility-associated C-terminal domain-containing protein [Candidatus Zixiibacteriota bacterium]
MIKREVIFIMLIMASLLCYGQPEIAMRDAKPATGGTVVEADTDSDMAASSLLEDAPDPVEDPEAYAAWKREYTIALRGSRSARPERLLRTMDMRVNNDYVAADLDETTGEFEQGADPGGTAGGLGGLFWQNLTFSWPESPGTEWVMYKIDDAAEQKTDETMPSTSRNYIDGDGAAVVEWDDVGGVKIKQSLLPQSLSATPGANEQIRFKAEIWPVDSSCHDVGCIVFYDTQLDGDDAAEISTSFGYAGISEIFFAPSLPSMWRAYEGGYPPSGGALEALGILTGFEAVMPDVFWYGQWGTAVGNGWADAEWLADAGGTFGDSATMVKWYQREVCPGDTLEFVTYYGIGELIDLFMYFEHYPPDLEGGCAGEIIPYPIPIEAYITNGGSDDACNVRAYIDLPSGLSIATGSLPIDLGTLPGSGGSTTAMWGLNADPSTYGTTQSYTIRIEYDDCSGGATETIEEDYTIDIPTPSDISSEVIADDTLLCAGESTRLHLSYSGGVPPYSFVWYSTGFPTPEPVLDPVITPDATNTYFAYVTDDEGCVVADTVTVYVYDPIADAGIDAVSCGDESIRLGGAPTAFNGHEPYTYTWTPASGLDNPTIANPNANPSSSMWYHLTVIDSLGCTAYDSVYVQVSDLVVDAGTDTTICRGSSITLGGSPTVSGGAEPYVYEWYPPEYLDDATSANPVATPEMPMAYTVTISDSLGCSIVDTVNIGLAASPVAEFTTPDPCDGITTCSDQWFTIYMEDTSGAEIDESSISVDLTINGTTETLDISDSRLTYYPPDTLRFEPSPEWEHGDTVTMDITSFANDAGCTGTPISCSFIVDTEPPEVITELPSDGSTIHVPTPMIRLELFDEPAGIDSTTLEESSTTVWVNSTEMSGYDVYFDGVNFDIIGLTFEDGDSVYICVDDFADNPTLDYCPPNDTSFCWSFRVSMAGPGATVVQYLTGSFVACEPDSQMVVFDLVDSDGIVESSIEVEVHDDSGDRTITIGPELDYDSAAEELTFIPSTPWDDGETVSVCITAAEDPDGNPLSEVVCDTFYIDLVAPAVEFISPLAGDVLSPDDSGSFSIVITDEGAGVDGSSVLLDLCGITYPFESTSGDTFFFDIGMTWGDASCTTACIIAADDPDYCSANIDTTCQILTLTTGPESDLISPASMAISACEGQCIRIHLYDEDLAVDASTIELMVEDSVYDTSMPELNYDPTEEILTFCPAENWANEQVVNFELIAAEDAAGVSLTRATIDSFIVDLEAPMTSSEAPGEGDVVATPDPTVCFDITDNLAGVDFTSIIINIDGSSWDSTTSSVEITGDNVCFDPTEAGLSWTGGTVVDFCVEALDLPDTCSANVMDTCWSFEILSGGPVARIIDYSDGSYVSCDPQLLVMEIADSNGVIGDSIEFTIERSTIAGVDTFTIDSAGVSWTEPRLEYSPSIAFENGEDVTVTIIKSYDELGNAMEAFPSATFTMDMTSPVMSGASPAAGSIVLEPSPEISFELTDDLSGVDSSSIEVMINGISYEDGICLTISPITDGYEIELIDTCYEFTGCDTVEVDIVATDDVDYCDDNILDTSWVFYMECEGPEMTIIHPLPEDTTSCILDSLVFSFDDDPPGIDETSIEFTLNGEDITWPDPDLTFDESSRTFVYHPPSGEFPEGINNVEVTNCTDLLGNPMEGPVSWTFLVDHSGPEIFGFDPVCGDTAVPTTAPVIEFYITDEYAGVNPEMTTLDIFINGIFERTVAFTDPSITFDGDSSWSFDALGSGFSGGDSVCIVYHATDLADDYAPICPPNSSADTCCFGISAGGPMAIIHYPSDGDYNACPEDSILSTIEDIDGIIDSTILVTYGIHGCSGEIDSFGVDDPEVIWDAATGNLVFHPDPPMADGDTVCFSIIEATDSILNPIGREAQVWFIVDYTAPYIIDQSPAPDAVIELTEPTICMELADDLAGIEESSIVLTIDGIDYSISNPAISWDGAELCFDPVIAGISWTGGDTIDIGIFAEDMITLCDPNILDSTWSFSISIGGPITEVIRPLEGAVVACNPDSITWTVSDTNGILWNTAEVRILTWTGTDAPDEMIVSPGPELHNGFRHLTFSPTGDFLIDGDSVYACITYIEDSLANPMDTLEGTNCVRFLVDRTPPEYTNLEPTSGSTVFTNIPDIVFELNDNSSGIDSADFVISIEPLGLEFGLDDPCITLDHIENTVTINPLDCGFTFDGGVVNTIILEGADNAWSEFCGPNVSDTSWTFEVAAGPPQADIIMPDSFTFSSCPDQEILIHLIDADVGVDDTTIVLSVMGADYRVDDDELSYANDTLRFIPSTLFSNGDVVNVRLERSCDILGNCATNLLDWSFTIDLQPPLYEIIEPASIFMLDDLEQDIVLSIDDELSGIDESSIVFVVNFEDSFSVDELEYSSGMLRFKPEDNGMRFVPGDSVYFSLFVTDTTDYCADNILDTLNWFTLQPKAYCLSQPNPFTPNFDDFNDVITFEYPQMFNDEAELKIFDRRKRLIYDTEIGPFDDMVNIDGRTWNGLDNNGKEMKPGLYFYIIEVDGEVVCNGSIVLVR